MTRVTLEQVQAMREEEQKQFHRFTQERLRKMWAKQAEAERRIEAGAEEESEDEECYNRH